MKTDREADRAGDGSATAAPQAQPSPVSVLRLVRIVVAGVLMGIANLIPGVSGGTMVLAMGLYQEFIDSVADVTAFRFSVRRLTFLVLLGCCALAAIKLLAGGILFLLFHYPVAMYAAFIGLTLGGAPMLVRSLRPMRVDVVIGTLAGLLLMIGVLLLKQGAGFPHNLTMDFINGVVGATTMVLPGVSGSYMLLVMDQYERVIGAIEDLKLTIIVPVGVGAIVGIVGLSHLLKALLHRWARPTLAVLLGILLGSVIGLWPFGKGPGHKALERRSPAELRAFAVRWQISGAEEAHADELAGVIRKGWEQRGRSGYSVGSVGGATALLAAGFLITSLLGRLKGGSTTGRESGAAPGTGRGRGPAGGPGALHRQVRGRT